MSVLTTCSRSGMKGCQFSLMVSRSKLFHSAFARQGSLGAHQTSRRSFQRTKTTASTDSKCHEQREYSLLSFTYTKPHKCSKSRKSGGSEKPKPTLKAKVKSIVFAMTLCHAKKRRPSSFSVSNDTWIRKESPDPPELECIERPVELRSEQEPQELEGDYPAGYTPPPDEQPARTIPQPEAESARPNIPSIQITEDQAPIRRRPESLPNARRKPRPRGSAKSRIQHPITPAGNGARTTTQNPSRLVSRLLVPSSPTTPFRKSESYPWSPDDVAAEGARPPRSDAQSRTPTTSLTPSTSSPKISPAPLFSCLCWREHKSDSFNQPLPASPTSTTSTLVESRPESSWLTEKQVCEPPDPGDDGDDAAAVPQPDPAPLGSATWFQRNFQPVFSSTTDSLLRNPLPNPSMFPGFRLFQRCDQVRVDSAHEEHTEKVRDRDEQDPEKPKVLNHPPALSEVRVRDDLIDPEKTGGLMEPQRMPAGHSLNVRHVERAQG